MPACPALAGLTHSAWPLASLPEPRTRNPVAPAQLSLHMLLPYPAIQSSVHSIWGRWVLGSQNIPTIGQRIPVKHVIELLTCGARGECDKKGMRTWTETKAPDNQEVTRLRLCPFQGPGHCLRLFPQHLTLHPAPPPQPWLPSVFRKSPAEYLVSLPHSKLCGLAVQLLFGALPAPGVHPACSALPAESHLVPKPCLGSFLKSHHHSSHLYNPTCNTPYSSEH